MARREYEGDGITVHWDSDRCIHSQLCVLGLPAVFDHGARPWVNAAGAPADDVARVIDTCPSGALTYTRTDGAPNGRRGRAWDDDPADSVRSDDEPVAPVRPDAEPAPAERRPVVPDVPTTPTITPLPDGPLLVRGPLGIARADGEVEIVQRATLCRCGQSQSKPHCDGSHARVGFTAPGAVPPVSG